MHKSVIKIMRVSIASQNAQYTYVREKDREEKKVEKKIIDFDDAILLQNYVQICSYNQLR